MKRVGLSMTAFLAAALLLGGTALASNEWCDEDPVFTALGATFSLTTGINAAASSVSSISYVVEVPQNAGHVRVAYPGGRTLPTTVTIVRDLAAYDGDGSFPVVAKVTVSGPAATTAVIVTAGGSTAPATASGTVSAPLTLSFSVSPRNNDQGEDQN